MTPTDPIQSAPTRIVTPEPRTTAADLGGKDPFRPRAYVRVENWNELAKSLAASLRFLMETEVHVYAFAVAVNILISFYPFLVATILICRHVLHWQAAIDLIINAVAGYFPADFGMDMSGYLRQSSWHELSWLSLLLLFFTANGIFTPLEVAFNRIWRAKRNRSFVWNQAVSLGLIFLCGALVIASVSFTTVNAQFLSATFGSNQWAAAAQSAVLRVVAVPVTIVAIFSMYWLLPNCSIPVARLLPPSIAVALLLQISAYVNMLTWPWLHDKLRHDVPPFVQSISIVFWAFITTLIVLAGAEWAARVRVDGHRGEAYEQRR